METNKPAKKAGMMKIILICAICLMAVGAVICIIISAISGIPKTEIKKHEETLAISDNCDIRIINSTEDINIYKTDESIAKITYYDRFENNHIIVNNTDSLTFTAAEQAFSLFNNLINYTFDNTTTELYLPANFTGKISISSTTGDIYIKDLSASTLTAKLTTGSIKAESTTTADMLLETTTGDMYINNLTSENVKCKSTTGDVQLIGVNAKAYIHCKASTGSISIYETNCGSVLSETTTGDIRIDKLSADSIEFKATTGDVFGTIAGKEEDYRINVNSDTGLCTIHSKESGDKSLKAKTTTGDIDINFK